MLWSMLFEDDAGVVVSRSCKGVEVMMTCHSKNMLAVWMAVWENKMATSMVYICTLHETAVNKDIEAVSQ